MAHPVPIPLGRLSIDEATNTIAELIVERIAQVMRYGTAGTSVETPPTLYPDGPDPEIDPLTGRPKMTALALLTKEQQLYYRQLAVAVAATLGVMGTIDPALVSTLPGPSLVPRADGAGKLDIGWLPSELLSQQLFTAECPSTTLVGDLVRVSGADLVDHVDITDPTKLPAIGAVVEKIDPITAKVQTTGLVAGYAGLMPGARYFAGASSRPVMGAPVPSPGTSLFHQPVGVALDPTTLILSPSVHIARIRG